MAEVDAAAARRQFGDALYRHRKASGLSFHELQSLSGILSDQQENWEAGVELPDPHDLTSVLRAMDQSPAMNRAILELFKRVKEISDAEDTQQAFEYFDSKQSDHSLLPGEQTIPSRSPDRKLLERNLVFPPAGRVEVHGIFISYRRSDQAAVAGRLFDRLAAKFGESQVFMDVDSIDIGLDFASILDAALRSVKVAIVVIGRNWLSAEDEHGGRRLDNPDDYVRQEIETVLQRGIPVIPILVDGTPMPHGSDLPESIRPLARRNGREISHTTFGSDISELISGIGRILRP